MAGVKISNLPSATTPLSGTETVPLVQSGVTSKATVTDIGDAATYTATGTGAVSRLVSSKLGDFVSVKDFGAVGDGVTDDTAAILAAAVAARTAQTDGTGRTICKAVYLPAGNYRITSAVELAPSNGLTGLTVFGDGSGATFINYIGGSTQLSCRSSRAITFRDICFTSSGVDSDQTAFRVVQTGNPLRSWRFERCDFAAFYTCFDVSGASMCSEFFFNECQFSQCYYLMVNDNDQAVNWNFVNCNWENNELSTTKALNSSAMFFLKKGTFVKWTGGSLIFHGLLAFFNLTASGVFQRTSHKIIFDGVRIELVDNAGTHAYMIDKTSVGYVNGSNQPTVALTNFTILNRGTLSVTTPYFKVWANCSLALTNGEAEGGIISGVLDGVTATQNADVRLTDTRGITYVEDTTSRVSDHDSHNVHIEPDTSSADTAPIIDLKLSSLSVPASVMPKHIYVRGPTGSLPLGGTTVNLPSFPDHTNFVKLFCYRFTAATQTLTVEFKDQADTTVYGTVTLLSATTNSESYIGKEMGFQIPTGTPLMLKFTGTADIVKGIVGVEYI